uniref:Uncharacterized protein n=1 Tax=Anopheles dirus TaxID=7168 RepID=A0A182NXA5_9DIPT
MLTTTTRLAKSRANLFLFDCTVLLRFPPQ